MATKIKIRNDNSATWTATNPTLSKGEIGVEIDDVVDVLHDTKKMKIGDGVTAWNDLGYFTPADDDEFYTLLETETVNDDADYVVIYDSSTNTYKNMTRKHFLKLDNIKVITTVANVKLIENSEDLNLIYVLETDTVYRYLTLGSVYTADNKHVITTFDVGDTRWLAISGQFMVKNIDLQEGSEYRVNGVKVVGAQQNAISDVTGTASGVYDSNEEAIINSLKTKLNDVLEILRTHGLIEN